MYYWGRLKKLRENKKLTQAEIAQILQITRQQYSLYEIGKREIPVRYLEVLAKYYGTSVDYILELIDEAKPYHCIKK